MKSAKQRLLDVIFGPEKPRQTMKVNIQDGEDQMEVTITKPKQRNTDDINWPDD